MTVQFNRVTAQRVADGKVLHATAVNEHQARAAAGITMALGATAFVYANFDKLFWPIRTVSTFLCVDFLCRVTVGLERSPSGRAPDDRFETCANGARDVDVNTTAK